MQKTSKSAEVPQEQCYLAHSLKSREGTSFLKYQPIQEVIVPTKNALEWAATDYIFLQNNEEKLLGGTQLVHRLIQEATVF